jgi:hypothetical protein
MKLTAQTPINDASHLQPQQAMKPTFWQPAAVCAAPHGVSTAARSRVSWCEGRDSWVDSLPVTPAGHAQYTRFLGDPQFHGSGAASGAGAASASVADRRAKARANVVRIVWGVETELCWCRVMKVAGDSSYPHPHHLYTYQASLSAHLSTDGRVGPALDLRGSLREQPSSLSDKCAARQMPTSPPRCRDAEVGVQPGYLREARHSTALGTGATATAGRWQMSSRRGSVETTHASAATCACCLGLHKGGVASQVTQ